MSELIRPSGRKAEQMRSVTFDTEFTKHPEGCCFIKCGDTHVLCTASVEKHVPSWLRGSGQGWITAEYGMIPRSTRDRMRREAIAGKQSGRTQEIQRFIGRSLRAVVDLKALGEYCICIDCDVIQADGGTRTASITGAWIALRQAMIWMQKQNMIQDINTILQDHIAALSCGIYQDTPIADLDYAEDSIACTDGNFVMTGRGKIVEIQITAEGRTFSENEFTKIMSLARHGIGELIESQKQAINKV